MMRNRMLAILLPALLAAPMADAATLVVVEARGIGLKPGATLDAAKPLVLKQGQHVTLISETGSTLKLDGPYDQPPTATGGSSVTLTNSLGALVSQRQARSGEFGTTRGTVLAALPDPWLVDATHGGNGCLLENRTPVFWRPDAGQVSSLMVAPVDRSWKAEAKWPAGANRLSITTDVPMRGGETYVVSFNGAESAISMTLVPASLTNDAMRAAWMADKGCEAQAEALSKTVK
jgi:hypothetical protein